MAEDWWRPDGPMRPLHRLNPTRLAYLRDRIADRFGRDPRSDRPFAGLRAIDIGCGGGLLSEPMARLGAAVTGIDAAELAQLSPLPLRGHGTHTDVVKISDTPYDPALWKGADDEGVGGYQRDQH